MKKILIFAVYPAPYRVVVADGLSKEYETDIFFSNAVGDQRDSEWFSKGKFNSLSDKKGKEYFRSCKKDIKKYDLVFLMDYTCKEAVKLILRCKRKKVPYAINCDGQMLVKHGSFFANIIKKFLIRGASGYLASGKHAEEYFLRFGAKKERIYFHKFTSLKSEDILPVALSYDEKTALREKFSLPTDGKIAIAVGRFIPLKRYDVLISLWKTMPSNAYLLLIGGGSERGKYEKIISELGLTNVILEDFHKPDELLEYFCTADIFVHPTTYDAWGLVVNEAMASGLPVIASDTCVAARELIVNGKNGYRVKLYDDEEFIKRVNEFLNDDELRKVASVNAIETIKDYTVENMVAENVINIGKILENDAK